MSSKPWRILSPKNAMLTLYISKNIVVILWYIYTKVTTCSIHTKKVSSYKDQLKVKVSLIAESACSFIAPCTATLVKSSGPVYHAKPPSHQFWTTDAAEWIQSIELREKCQTSHNTAQHHCFVTCIPIHSGVGGRRKGD